MATEEKADSNVHGLTDILKVTREQDYFYSFLRVDKGDGDGETGDGKSKKKGGKKKTEKTASAEHTSVDPMTTKRERDRPRSDTPPPAGPTTFQELSREIKLRAKAGLKQARGRKSRMRRMEEVYTDKDRAAAVNMGSRDIKQSLKLKRKQDRSRALQIPEEAEPGTLLALGNHEMRTGQVSIAINFVDKVYFLLLIISTLNIQIIFFRFFQTEIKINK